MYYSVQCTQTYLTCTAHEDAGLRTPVMETGNWTTRKQHTGHMLHGGIPSPCRSRCPIRAVHEPSNAPLTQCNPLSPRLWTGNANELVQDHRRASPLHLVGRVGRRGSDPCTVCSVRETFLSIFRQLLQQMGAANGPMPHRPFIRVQ
jgi:hypothetical protein